MTPPPPPLDEALPSRRPSAPPTPGPTPKKVFSSATVNGRGLLSKRVLSVEAFRLERLERSRLTHPPVSSSKAIPVPLYPGETQPQYNYKFKQWLAKKNESFEALSRDPKRERKMWLVFAFQRSKPVVTERTGPQRVPKRSIDEEYEVFYQRSASHAIKRLRRDRSMESDRSTPRGRSPAPRVEPPRPDIATSSRHREELTDGEMPYTTHSHSIDRRDEHLSSIQIPPRKPRQRSSSPASHSSQTGTDQLFNPRSRTEIMAPRVLSVEEYLRELKGPKQNNRSNAKLAKIPMPLFPGETVDDYEQDFGRWLHYRQTSVLSLRCKPLKERVYRHQFAQQRAMKKTTPSSFKRAPLKTHSQSPMPTAKGGYRVAHKASFVPVRDEDKNLNMGGSKTSPPARSPPTLSSTKECPKHDDNVKRTSHNASCASNGNHDQKRKTESESRHSATRSSTPTQDSISHPRQTEQIDENISEANTPKKESHKPAKTLRIISGVPEDSSARTLCISGIASNTLKPNISTQDELPGWAMQLINRVKELESTVAQLQRKGDYCRSCSCCKAEAQGAADQSAADPTQKSERSDYKNPSPSKVSPSKRPPTSNSGIVSSGSSHSNGTTVHDDRTNLQGQSRNVKECVLAPDKEQQDASTTKNIEPAEQSRKKSTELTQTNEDIHRDATRNLARAVQSRVKEDTNKHRLTEEYDHLNEQISMNETAIDDALDYIKAIKGVDEAVAMEQHGQIMELVVSINKEKQRRNAALADLIVYSFAKDTLVSLLEEEPSRERISKANHEKLRAISSQIEQKDSVLETIEMHLNEQLQWVTGIPSCVSEAGKTLRFKALRKMSKRLTKEQAAKELLEREREEVLKTFFHCDREIRKLVMETLQVK